MSRILVIDDDRLVRFTIRTALEQAGHTVAEAEDGARGLVAFDAGTYDLVITDLLMPEKDGIETIAHFRAEFPRVRIIAMSGGGTRVRGERYLGTAAEIGADAILSKPFEIAALLDTLRRVANVAAR